MLVGALFLVALAAQPTPSVPSTEAPATTTTTSPPEPVEPVGRQRISIEPVIHLSARGAASRVETSLTTWLGLRVGTIFNDAGGFFAGGDAAVLVGAEGAGTDEVEVTRAATVVDARALAGWRAQRGFVGLAGYGYAGGLVGGGEAVTHVFDDEVSRSFVTAGLKGGVGLETTFGIGLVRLETGLGMRDAHFELHGTFAAGVRF